MKILIFDTCGGLCNQFYDINCAINFCLINDFKFSFRNCTFRNANLVTWYDMPIEDLFDMRVFEKYDNYVKFQTLTLTIDNTFNLVNSLRSIQLFTNNYLQEILDIDKEYIVLKQFWVTYSFCKIIDNLNGHVLPSNKVMKIYENIKNKLSLQPMTYNFIHYRHEIDFISFFNIKNKTLENVVLSVMPKFKDTNLKIYVATSNFKSLIENTSKVFNSIITKNDDELTEYNFEELAFVDYMIGLHSCEVFGHSKSSFSGMVNSLKNTSNYYDV